MSFKTITLFGVVFLALWWGISNVIDELYLINLKKEISKSQKAKIIDVKCGSKDNIKFVLSNKIYNERIYLSYQECVELSKSNYIDVIIGEDYIVVFTNPKYNDSSINEVVAIVLLSFGFALTIVIYGIIPRVKRNSK